jgi:hypothetical protein
MLTVYSRMKYLGERDLPGQEELGAGHEAGLGAQAARVAVHVTRTWEPQ